MSLRPDSDSDDTDQNKTEYQTVLLYRMVNRVTHDFEEMIEGGGNHVDTTTLSGGAKINTIFHFRFPGYLNEVFLSSGIPAVTIADITSYPIWT